MGRIRDLCDKGEDKMRSSGRHRQTSDGSAVPAGAHVTQGVRLGEHQSPLHAL